MKKMFTIIFAFFVVQCAFAQKMQIHTSTMGTIEVQLSNVDSITFTVSGGLQVNPNNMYVPQGGSMQAMINGGKTPYNIQSAPNSSIATASIAGNLLTVNGVTVGSTNLVVKDNSSPVQTVMVNILVTTGPGGLMANPDYLSLSVAAQKTSAISGGTTPYSIMTAPASGVASASISGSVVTVTGVGGGNTFIVVKDNSSPYKTATINVDVHQIFTTPGSLSFSSTVGNFSATGIFDNATDSMPSNAQGAGGFFSHDLGPFAALEIVGYVINSSTSWDIAIVTFADTSSLITGSHPFLTGEGPIKRAEFMYIKGWNPDTADNPFDNGSYMLVTGSGSLSSYTGTSAQGTFSGTGTWFAQDTPDPARPITLTNGTFTVPVISGSIKASAEKTAIEKLIHRLNR